MVDRLARASAAVRRGSEVTDDATVREQLRSIEEGLHELTEADETADDGVSTRASVPNEDELEAVEEKLVDLSDEAEGTTRRHLETARDAIDAYRRANTL